MPPGIVTGARRRDDEQALSALMQAGSLPRRSPFHGGAATE